PPPPPPFLNEPATTYKYTTPGSAAGYFVYKIKVWFVVLFFFIKENRVGNAQQQICFSPSPVGGVGRGAARGHQTARGQLNGASPFNTYSITFKTPSSLLC
ncbi:hypothetical protein ACVGWV_25810, partial [Enterobacter asburiae]